uniref:ABO, alpha 1-3-N-acetylgalactosaminyltransferase and alpha 1-3-galactosyltransferase n=1 Tax=Oryctolagus cuniculus TaxID=9986 RepID=G1U7R7_RABIT
MLLYPRHPRTPAVTIAGCSHAAGPPHPRTPAVTAQTPLQPRPALSPGSQVLCTWARPLLPVPAPSPVLSFCSVAVGDPDGRPVVALSRMLYPQPKALTPGVSWGRARAVLSLGGAGGGFPLPSSAGPPGSAAVLLSCSLALARPLLSLSPWGLGAMGVFLQWEGPPGPEWAAGLGRAEPAASRWLESGCPRLGVLPSPPEGAALGRRPSRGPGWGRLCCPPSCRPCVATWLSLCRRSDVLVLTPWLAPIVWEGTFSPEILDEQFRLQNVTVGLTVFAVKKYVAFLRLFLETAEQHFMVGHRVTYYVFTNRPADVPHVPLREGRRLAVLTVRSHARWQDVSMHRMEVISRFSEQRFRREVDYLVCADVDMKFRDHVGVEILSRLFGTLHPGFYTADRRAFAYERRPRSQAYIPPDEGDFYYMGALFGGSVAEVQRLASACHQAMVLDKANGIEAVWHDESHLNRYLLYHKPTKVLSPEYLWDQQLLGWPSVMKKLRFVAVPKNHEEMRSP